MPSSVALLRGINVGGRNLIGMPDLAACFRDAGYQDVRTYIQSGNVLFTANLAAGAKLFIVPTAEVKQAKARAGSKATVVGVKNIEGALRALREHGGAPVHKIAPAQAA